MDKAVSSLLLKSNRILGTRLVETGLITLPMLEEANTTFVSRVRAKELQQASLLRILLFETQSLSEDKLLDHLLENHPVGGLDLMSYKINATLAHVYGVDLCRATWTLPLDSLEQTHFLATSYYLSDVVRQHWETQLEGDIIWYVCPMNNLEQAFEAFSSPAPSIEEEN